jgi:hypothetical protein
MKYMYASHIGANDSHVEGVEYLTYKNYSILNVINIKIYTYYCFMLRNFFRRSTDHKQRVNKIKIFLECVNKKENVEIDRSASSGGQGKYKKCLLPLASA